MNPSRLVPLLLLPALGCGEEREPGDSAPPEHTLPGDTDTDGRLEVLPPPPDDFDGDGYDRDEDCDDLDPAVHPAAEELWNDRDDDCDGRIDGDGDYQGNSAVTASAVYEAQIYRYEMDCPTTMSRSEGALSFSIQCVPDLSQPHADILLGKWVNIEVNESDTAVSGSSWSGRTEIRSANGWDSRGEASITWSDMDHATIVTTLDAYSLDMSGVGALELLP